MRGGGMFQKTEIGTKKTGTAKFMKFPIKVGPDGPPKPLEYPIEYTITEIIEDNSVARIKISKINHNETKGDSVIYIKQPIPPNENYSLSAHHTNSNIIMKNGEIYMLSEITSLNTPPPTASE
jgi:hypothetical protein